MIGYASVLRSAGSNPNNVYRVHGLAVDQDLGVLYVARAPNKPSYGRSLRDIEGMIQVMDPMQWANELTYLNEVAQSEIGENRIRWR